MAREVEKVEEEPMARVEHFDGTEVGPGYCRMLRMNDSIFISGTGSADGTGTVVGSSVYEQTKEIYRKINFSLKKENSSLKDVVRICAYITDINFANEFMAAHAEAFGDVAPACTLVEVSALVKGFKIEIEAQACI